MKKSQSKSINKRARYSSNKNSKNLNKMVKILVLRTLRTQAEDKYLDQSIQFTDPTYSEINAAGFVWNLNLESVGVGTSPVNRIGEKITVKNVTVCGEVGMVNGLTVDAFNKVRFILFIWKPGSNSSPSVTDILYSYSLGGADVNAPYNPGSFGKSRILHDKSYVLSSSGQQGRSFKFDYTLNQNVRYDANAAYINANTIWLLAISDSNVTPHPILALNSRITFTDL
jgi:hypothetical protein